METFLVSAQQACKHMGLVTEKEIFSADNYDHIIFEGSQGIMLDMDHGLFPNVTRSNTTCKNAMQIIQDNNLSKPEVYYITRAYTTRHGKGWMPNEDIELPDLGITIDPEETNKPNEWQGKFRRSMLDINTLNYAVQIDSNFSPGLKKYLVVTCMDHVEKFRVTKDGHVKDINDISDLVLTLDFTPELIYFSASPDPERVHIGLLDLTTA